MLVCLFICEWRVQNFVISLSLSRFGLHALTLYISAHHVMVRTCVYVSLNASETDSECVIVEAIELS